MSEKAIVHKVPENVRKQSIETLKVHKKSLEYLRQNGYKTIDDIIERQNEIPTEIRGNIYAYIMAWRDKVKCLVAKLKSGLAAKLDNVSIKIYTVSVKL